MVIDWRSLLVQSWARSLGLHFVLFLLCFAVQKIYSTIPVAALPSPIEVIVVGDVDSLPNSKNRLSRKDIKEGVIIDQAGARSAGGSRRGRGSKKGLSRLLVAAQSFSRTGKKSKSQPRPVAVVGGVPQREELLAEGGPGQGSVSRRMKVISGLPQGPSAIQWKKMKIGAVQSQKDLSPKELDKVRKLLAGKFSTYRDCYERALLFDSALSGYLEMKIRVRPRSTKSGVDLGFRGASTKKGLRVLKDCVRGVSENIRFPENLVGETIRFELRVTS